MLLPAWAQPMLVDTNLAVRTNVSGLLLPTTMAFLGDNDMLVLEKETGKVQRVINGVIQPTPAIDLAVNYGSERGLLGITLHPDFPEKPYVYLYWTESTTGTDTNLLSATPLLGNRVDRFTWDGSTLTMDTNIIHLHALQEDATNPGPRGNHNGGNITFGLDKKLYIYIGDNGRRGQMQNLPDGPGPGGNQPDDQFGGPEPDNAHLTGVILRLNDDGTTPTSNPFYKAGASRGGEPGANLQKVFAYGIRNGFGMSVDPYSGDLWEAQNGDDTFTEINRVERGSNLGWIQVMGPLSRLAQFKEIETSSNFFGLQQVRWSPTNIADHPLQARSRLFNVFDGGKIFAAFIIGAEEVPPVDTRASAFARFELKSNGTLEYQLRALSGISNLTMAHIHLGAAGQNGPVTVFLFGPTNATTFGRGELIASGVISETNVIALPPGFTNNTVSNLVARMRQGRTYVNLHTTAHPGGEIRGEISVADRKPVSHYSDPEFSWKYEVAPAGLGFISSRALGEQYKGNMIVGAARDFLQGGTLFRFELKGKNHRDLVFKDQRLRDRVADNLAKFDITESESLLFGTGFGVGTDIETGPNGNLYVVSLSNGAIYEIYRRQGNNGRPDNRHHGDKDDDDDNNDNDNHDNKARDEDHGHGGPGRH